MGCTKKNFSSLAYDLEPAIKISYFGHKRLLKLGSKLKMAITHPFDLQTKKIRHFIYLKVEENKVPLFFGLENKWMGYGHFEFQA